MDLNKAQQAFEQENYQEALKILGSDDQNASIVLKAYCLQKLNDYEQAMECWNILIQREPQHAQFYNERGVCKFNLRFKHAITDFDKAIELENDNPYFYASRAYVKDKLGDTEGAVQDYTKAHDLDPEDAITLNNLGLAEQKLGHTQKARAFFQKSNDLLGLDLDEGVDETPTKAYKPSLSEKFREVRRMLSSTEEFKKFLREALGRS